VEGVAKETGNEALPSSLGAVSSIILVYGVFLIQLIFVLFLAGHLMMLSVSIKHVQCQMVG
jgi:hypothetical protein